MKRGTPKGVRRQETEAAFDAITVAEFIETSRAQIGSLAKLAGTISNALFEYYDYEGDEPELWLCCRLIRQVLEQVEAALRPLGDVSHDTPPLVTAMAIATGCEVQRQWLRPAAHVVRATIHVLLDIKPAHEGELLPGLRDLERGLLCIVDGLEHVIQLCPIRTARRAPR